MAYLDLAGTRAAREHATTLARCARRPDACIASMPHRDAARRGGPARRCAGRGPFSQRPSLIELIHRSHGTEGGGEVEGIASARCRPQRATRHVAAARRRRMGWGAGARNDGGRGRCSVSEWRRAGPLRRGTDRNAVRRRISSANCDDFSANLDGDLAVRLERGEDVGELLVGERRLLLVAREVKLLHLDPVLLVRLLSRGLRTIRAADERQQRAED